MRYTHLTVTTDQWFKMTVKQCDTYVRKLRVMMMAEVMKGERSTVVNFTSFAPLSASWETLQSPLDDVVLSNI